MASRAHPYDLIGAELRALAEQEGPDLWRNRIRLTGLLLDHQPELRREIRAVVSAVEQGVAHALADTERSLSAIAIDRQASLLETESGLRPEIALSVTRTIAHALNLGPLPSVYSQTRSIPAAPPGPIAPPPHTPVPPQTFSHHHPPPHLPTSVPLHALTPHGWSDPHPSQGYSGYAPRRRFPWAPVILGTAVLAAAAIIIAPRLGGDTVNNIQANNTAINGTAARVRPPNGWANEDLNFGIAGTSELRQQVGGSTPTFHPYATRITTEQLQSLIANRSPELIDVLAQGHPQTLPNAHFLPSAGQPGTYSDQFQLSTEKALDHMTGGDRAAHLVFYCLGVACWESYNAALRARQIGYTNLYWYRGGLEAWQAAGLPMQPLPAAYSVE